ncbi:MAG TPA: polysaccharide biosynthesis tyrosine autokinase [Blastocatellia bacterium]|nr:polysaccharide biosynthesis tyrosine autokinase [Blastocatellia bacterium]
MAEEKNNSELPQLAEEALLLRPSGVSKPNSFEQLAYNYGAGGAKDGFDPRGLWRKIRKRKWLVAAIVLIATIIVSIESFRTKSLYLATTKVAINKQSTIVRTGDLVLESNDSERVKTEILMLSTHPLLEEVIVRLKLDQNPQFLDIKNRKSVVEAVKTISAKLKGEPNTGNSIPPPLNLSPAQDAPRSTAESARLTPYVELLKENLFVDQIPETRALAINYSHTNPVIAQAVANGVAQVFVDFSFQNKISKYSSSFNWLDRTTRGLRAQMEQAERALADYSSSHNFFSPDEKQSLTVSKLATLYGQVLKAETDRILKQSLYEEVRRDRVAQLPEAFSDPRIVQWQNEMGKLQLKASELNSRFGPENPKVLETQQQIKELDGLVLASTRQLAERLKADYDRAVRDEALIRESLEQARNEAIQQNQAAIELNVLKQNSDTARALYNDFLQKTNQANIQVNEQQNDLKVIDPARVPNAPVGPKRLRAILIAIFLSLVAGIGLTFLLEYLDNTVKNVEDVARATQLPTLALIPAMEGNTVRTLNKKKSIQNKPVAGLAPRSMQTDTNGLATLDGMSSVVEAYRMLRTSVLLSSAGNPPKIILVTSSQPGEGKTTTAVNTAISLTQLGASVLLIDADLRRPAVHKAFKLSHARGLSNYLSGNAALSDLIVDLPIPNLSLLACGPIPPNPAELVSSERMKEMLRVLSQLYDHIIVDSPPLINVTDPIILSTIVDGTILVVQASRSTRDMLRRSRQELAGVGAKVFGVVLNNVDIKRDGYDEYYYYRYYSNYGQDGKQAES